MDLSNLVCPMIFEGLCLTPDVSFVSIVINRNIFSTSRRYASSENNENIRHQNHTVRKKKNCFTHPRDIIDFKVLYSLEKQPHSSSKTHLLTMTSRGIPELKLCQTVKIQPLKKIISHIFRIFLGGQIA